MMNVFFRSFLFFIMAVSVFFIYSDQACARAKAQFDKDYDAEIFIPAFNGFAVDLDSDNTPPQEPNFVKVDFLEVNPPKDLQERIDRLVQGITIDIPPEYDHYGYEIRRYMQAVGNEKIYTDENFLLEQRKNIKKAKIIFGYWRKHTNTEIAEIGDLLDKSDMSPVIRTAYKQNTTITRNFFSAMQDWIAYNENLLEFVFTNSAHMTLSYPKIYFFEMTPENIKSGGGYSRQNMYTSDQQKVIDNFVKIYSRKQAILKEIRTYAIFRLVIY